MNTVPQPSKSTIQASPAAHSGKFRRQLMLLVVDIVLSAGLLLLTFSGSVIERLMMTTMFYAILVFIIGPAELAEVLTVSGNATISAWTINRRLTWLVLLPAILGGVGVGLAVAAIPIATPVKWTSLSMWFVLFRALARRCAVGARRSSGQY